MATKKKQAPPPFKTWLISGLRKLCQRWPAYYETLNRIRVEVDVLTCDKKRDHYLVGAVRKDNGQLIYFKAQYMPRQGRRILLRCEQCLTFFLQKDYVKLKNGKRKLMKQVVVDHIKPVVNPEVGFTNWDDYIKGMFPSDEEKPFQAICRECHDIKCQKEREERKIHERSKSKRAENGV